MPKNPDFLNFSAFSSRSVWLKSIMELILFRFLTLYKGKFLKKISENLASVKVGAIFEEDQKMPKIPNFSAFSGRPVLIGPFSFLGILSMSGQRCP